MKIDTRRSVIGAGGVCRFLPREKKLPLLYRHLDLTVSKCTLNRVTLLLGEPPIFRGLSHICSPRVPHLLSIINRYSISTIIMHRDI